MTRDSRIEELLARWQQCRLQGQTLSPEELCGDCPELIPQVRSALEQLAKIELSLSDAATQPPSQPEGDSTGPFVHTFGRYHLHRLLGEGGMGHVYLARDGQLQRWVALKIPKLEGPDVEALRARFLQEARAAAALHHPNICPIHDLGEVEGTPYLTMPFLEGDSLKQKLAAQGALPATEAVRIVHKLALALHVAHEHGVIHRDLKPANVLLDSRQQPILMDFGLARRSDLTGSALTVTGQMMGTPAYMAPEQFGGDSEGMGPACDIYSLGVVLYELLTGSTPFKGDMFALSRQVPRAVPEPPSRRREGIDSQLEAVCLKALEKKPENRWISMQEFAEALETCLAERTGGKTSTPVTFPVAGPQLILRIKDTPYLYRPLPGQPIITVGRQRRKPGTPPDQGNDFVLRIADNDALSTRISRRHFEIHRRGEEYLVVDRSKHGLLVNGHAVQKHVETPLRPGDVLRVAGVIDLEVLIQHEVPQGAHCPIVRLPTTEPGQEKAGQVELEASMGDMITIE